MTFLSNFFGDAREPAVGSSAKLTPRLKRVLMLGLIGGVIVAAAFLGNGIEKHELRDCTVASVSEPILLQSGGSRLDITFAGCAGPVGEKTARLRFAEPVPPEGASPQVGTSYDLVVSESPIGSVDIVSLMPASGR